MQDDDSQKPDEDAPQQPHTCARRRTGRHRRTRGPERRRPRTIAADHSLLADLEPELMQRLLIAAGRILAPGRDAQRALRRRKERNQRAARRAHDAELLDETGIRSARREPVFATPKPMLEEGATATRFAPSRCPIASSPEASRNGPRRRGDAGDRRHPPGGRKRPARAPRTRDRRNCYVCKRDYYDIHGFYDAMCAECADFNWLKRVQTADLRGRVALVTGARVKIGYQSAIKLLRAGARVIATTRFPNDAAERYSKEADFEDWSDRLSIHGLDLRHTPSIEGLAEHLSAHWERLDFILNNACQTVRRPPGFLCRT